jgi:hypothetical protein
MVSEVNAPGIGGGPASPKRCAETHTRGRLNAYRWPRMVGRDLRTRRSAQRLPHSADKDEAGGSSPPRPTAGPDQRKRWLNTGEGSSWCASRAACARNSGRGVLAHGRLSGEQGLGVLSVCPIGEIGPGGVELVWSRHERPGSCGSHSLMTTVEARACRAIILDPAGPDRTGPR